MIIMARTKLISTVHRRRSYYARRFQCIFGFILLGILANIPNPVDSLAIGRISPVGNIYRRAGDDVRLVCNLNNATETTNSEHMNFTWPSDRNCSWYGPTEENVPDKFVRRLNYSAIELLIPSAPELTCLITCKLKTGKGIAYRELFVGHAPQPVTNFRCISNNWETMNCTFDFEPNPVLPIYTLIYERVGTGYRNDVTLRPVKNDSMPDYWFTIDNYNPVTEEYQFCVEQNNSLGFLSQNFTVYNLESIRPNRPTDLTIRQAVHQPGQPVNLTWKIDHNLYTYDLVNVKGKIITEINYTSIAFHNGEWVSQTLWQEPKELEKGCHLMLTGLTAHTWYDVRIRLRMSHSSPQRDDLWSDYAAQVFQTASRKPDNPPDTDIGAFWVGDKYSDKYNDVQIYWKLLRDYERNGENASYVITKMLVGGKPLGKKPILGVTSAKFMGMEDDTLYFEVHSSNAKGLSERASVIRVPRRSERPDYPRDLKKNRNGTIYTLSWMEPAHEPDMIDSYTVFWCESKSEVQNQCEESIYFQRVNASMKEFTINTTDGINFAVSANTKHSSSGMVWAQCTASKSDDIGRLKNIWTPKITATSMEIQWNLECVDRPILRRYSISYCPIKSKWNDDCKEGSEKFVNVSRDETQYQLTRLKPYTTYRTIITMISDTRAGPPSQPSRNTTYEATPSKPLNLVFHDVKNTSVQLRWDAPEHLNGVLKNYEVWYNGSHKAVDGHQGQKTINYTLENLTSFSFYEVVVLACSACCNCSESSNTISFRTEIGKPGLSLNNLTVNDAPLNRMIISWIPPNIRAGNLDFYEVNIRYTAQNKTMLTRIVEPKCFVPINAPSDLQDLQPGQGDYRIFVRAVNVLWSGHAKSHEFSGSRLDDDFPEQQHFHQGPDYPPAQSLEDTDTRRLLAFDKVQSTESEKGVPIRKISRPHLIAEHNDILKPCMEGDPKVDSMLRRDKFLTLLPGPWAQAYEHKTDTVRAVWEPLIALVVVVSAIVVGVAVFVHKRYFKLKKGSVVLPPGLTDIAEKRPKPEGKGGALGGHGNDLIIVSSSMSEPHAHESTSPGGVNSELYDRQSSSSSAPMVFEDHNMRHRPAGGGNDMQSSETNSLNEQEQGLLEDGMDARSSTSSSCSIEHEEGAMLGNVREEEDEEEPRSVLPISLQHEVLAAMVASKQQQQQQQLQQPITQHGSVIKPGSNGYVTIAQRSGGYTKLGDLVKPMHAVSPAEDKGITGYVTHKQLADFGQRMQ